MRASVLLLSLCVALPAGIAQTPVDSGKSAPGIGTTKDRSKGHSRPTIRQADTTPAITSLSTPNVNAGLAFTIDVRGTGFLATSQVLLNGKAAPTTKFVSSIDLQATGIASDSPGSSIAVTVTNPGGTKASNVVMLGVTSQVQVQLTPGYTMTIRCGSKLTVAAKVLNNSNQAVTWQVNGVVGGNATVGTISTAGVYNAPNVIPAGFSSVTIAAVAAADPSAVGNLVVELQNPPPAISSISPNPVAPDAASITINGTGFAQGAIVYLAEVPVTTVFVSDTKLTVAGPFAMPPGGIAAVKVVNPDPGTMTSPLVTLAMQLAAPKVTYTDAVRFLQMATFGPSPKSILELQTLGKDAWLAAQFNKPASSWPNPYSDAENTTRLQNAFFNVAINGDDQLRQRVAFALAQILVISNVKDNEFTQMVTYQRLLGDYAFGKFPDLLRAITLSPVMGYYLDMVNNNVANPATNTVANENYAREIMQLFSIGLTQLKQDGTSGGEAEYTQADIGNLAKVFTGWTYAPAPGYDTSWPNPAYYFAPMVPFNDHHDITQKVLNLPAQCVIPAGGGAEQDMDAALACILGQPNVAPFISYRLIQRLVMGNPSPGYVSRISTVFTQTGGDLKQVVTAILMDQEAASEGSGKLSEPVLYATGLLRELNATVVDGSGLAAQTGTMGQTPLASPTVFSFFSPFYTLNGTTTVEPEFQSLNAATALARANFAYRAVTNGLGGTTSINLSNWLDLANVSSDQLVDAVGQALFRGEMDSSTKSVLLSAAQNSTTAAIRVRSVLYAAAASPQYQVQR